MFKLTPEQEDLRALARRFARREILPVAQEYDRTGEVPWPVLNKAWEVGLINLSVPTAYGGGGQGVFEGCLVAEELAAGCSGIAATIGLNDVACKPIVLAGTEEQKQRFLTTVCQKRQFVSLCVTEPNAGSNVAALATTARRRNGRYLLSGTKRFISNASIASYYVVFAATDKAKGHRGLSAFVVSRETPGLTVGKKEDKLGQRAADTAEVILEEVAVGEENLLGQEGAGFRLIMETFNHSRPAVAAAAVGVARAAFEYAVEYARKREQFGLPIIMHQGIMFMLADMLTEIEAARLLAWKAAWLADQRQKNAREAAVAKLFAGEMVMRVATNAVQIFGGYGYTREYPVEKLLRDAKVFAIYEGTSQIQRLLIGRSLLSE